MTTSIIVSVALIALLVYTGKSAATNRPLEIWNSISATTIIASVQRSHVLLPSASQNSFNASASLPNDLVLGFREPGLRLEATELVATQLARHELRIYTNQTIRLIEVRDRSRLGTGGIVQRLNGGIDERYLYLVFGQPNEGRPIDFEVAVWTAAPLANGTPAAEFRHGNLTERSVIHFGEDLWAVPESESEVFEITVELPTIAGYYYTHIRAFDLSASGSEGGQLQIIRGGIGYAYVELRLTSVGPGREVRLHLATFAENPVTGGNDFWLGSWAPGLDSFGDYGAIQADAIRGRRVGRLFSYENDRYEISFVQAWDRVANGGGLVQDIRGGIGERFISFYLLSGVGQPLDTYVTLFAAKNLTLDANLVD